MLLVVGFGDLLIKAAVVLAISLVTITVGFFALLK